MVLLAVLPPWAVMAADTQPPAGADVENVAAPAEPGSVFNIFEYRVEGNTVLPVIAIEEAVYPYLGENKGIKDVKQARTNLEKAFHEAGYLTVLVDIPEQRVDAGIVRLRVTEAKIDRLRVAGSRFHSLERIKQQTPSLAEGQVPFFPDVQKELSELARDPDRQVTPVLRAGRAPGTVEAELRVKDELPLHGSVELNDRYSANTTRTRAIASLRYGNLWQRQHSLSLTLQTAPEEPDESKVLSATYVIPGARGQAYALYAVRSRSNIAAIDGYTALGAGNYFGVRWIKPLRGEEDYSHTLTFGADYKDAAQSVVGSADTIDTPITYTPLSVHYSGAFAGKQAATQFDIAANFNLRGVRDNESEFANKRFKAKGNYIYLRGGIQQTRQLPRKWSAFARLEAQASSGPLISNEQYAAGGVERVRGYAEAEALGDFGMLGTLELRTPSLFQDVAGMQQFYLLAFLEGASLRLHSPLPGQQSRFLLSSAGVGLRLKAFKGLSFNLDWALPFKGLTYTVARDSRIHAKLLYEF